MRIIDVTAPNNFNIFLYGDDHEGSVLRYNKGWEKFVDIVNSYWDGIAPEYNFAIDHGDVVEGILIDDPRYDPKTITQPQAGEQRDQAIENRKNLGNLKVILEGNHPWKLWKFENITQKVCNELAEKHKCAVRYGTWTCKIRWIDWTGQLLFKSYHTHGRKSITSTADSPHRREANMQLILQRHLREQSGDCVLMCKGHTHKLLILEPKSRLYLTDDGKEIKQAYTISEHTDEHIPADHRWYVNTGSFLKLFGQDVSGYAEIAEYPPIELGFAVCEVRDRKIKNVKKIIL